MSARDLSFVVRFCWAVGLAGLLVIVAAVDAEGVSELGGVAFAALSAGVLLGELMPVRLPLRGGEEEVNLSTPFSLALLVSAGLVPALVAQAVASVVQDGLARKPVWRTVFNVGQYALCLAAAQRVLLALGLRPGGEIDIATVRGVAAMAAAGGAFYAANCLIVGIAVARYEGTPLQAYLRSDWKTSVLMAAVSVSLAPLVLAAVDTGPLLVSLFVLPFIAVHRSGRLAGQNAHQALHDALTSLPNRTHFRRLVDRAIEASAEAGTGFAVMVLDLDRFKEVNDTLGHHYGDRLLETAAARLRGQLRSGDVVARLGGDEFAVLVSEEAADAVAERLAGALRRPVELDGFLLEIDASIGTARYPEDGDSVETLLQRADIAMYGAKNRHLDHVPYSASIDQHDPARLALVSDLRRGLQADELVVHYQPKLTLEDRRVHAAEALVRWQHPRLGLLQPAAFVELAEHTGLIKALTHHVLDRALRQCAAWRDDGLDLQVSVNVSPRSLLDRDLVATITGALDDAGVSASRLKLEITETAIMADPAAAAHVLHQLSAMGVTLSIDDFGTGYSSLGYLTRLPVQEVKIDRSFIQRMATDDGDRAIVRSTIDLAAHLGLTVVAEGVETPQTLAELARLGCTEAQGCLISGPLAPAALTTWLTRDSSPAAARTADPVP